MWEFALIEFKSRICESALPTTTTTTADVHFVVRTIQLLFMPSSAGLEEVRLLVWKCDVEDCCNGYHGAE